MTPFEYITVALSFVLGLGITRILLSAVYVFRSRKTLKLHWVPIFWALSIFLMQIQFWWAIFELNDSIEIWTVIHFGTLLLLALTLFVAGALVLPATKEPDSNNLLDSFEVNGRWALVFMSGYSLMGFWSNWFLFDVSPVSYIGGIVAVFVVLPCTYLFIQMRKIQNSITIIYLAFLSWFLVTSSPWAY